MTEFFKGSQLRTDSSPAYTVVVDSANRREVRWRNDLRQFAVVEWPPERPLPPSSLPAIIIERNTTDTGERRRFFGRTARRLVTQIKRSDAPDTSIEGWYVDVPGLPGRKRGPMILIAEISMGGSGRDLAPPSIEFRETGPAVEGYPVWQKTTSSALLGGSAVHKDEFVSVVTELIETNLPDRYFQPPEGYERVEHFASAEPQSGRTFGVALQERWRMFAEWLSSLLGGSSSGGR